MKNKVQIPRKKRRFSFVSFSILLVFALLAGSWGHILFIERAHFFELFNERNLEYAKKFFSGLFGFQEEKPAFVDKESWKNAIQLTYETLQMSVMALGFATIVAMLTVIPASRTIADGTLTVSKRWYHWILFGIIRGLYIFSRAVPELVFAMVIVFIFKPGILPGAIALALHNFGIIGKLCAEVIEDTDARPIRNLASAGASNAQILFYGIIPAVMPKFLTYILYRGEVIMRTSIVVGFVGAGGLGQQFKLSLSYFHYTEITLLLICYIILVFIADFISEGFRKAAR
ncbi:PhnE/PtxC family ABC transporter permease [Peribacillus glennii]|uniref:ABC transporter permease subunit n=1 Tax=Peribacillus glennii TaxID=2303991 RepID=A0A372L9I9_9BACI|nr:ABC transporter permease subunit [Peribacillus glennii]RFU61996.1 ABC transporter permease subunit [Peribacillus glennii]